MGSDTTRAHEWSGVYLRDSHGSVYEEARPLPGTHIAPFVMALVYDSGRHTTYGIDLTGKRVWVLPQRGLGDDSAGFQWRFAPDPPTPEVFYSWRSKDKPLGRKRISGVECLGFRIGSSPYRYAEVWFAPSLNFLAVRTAVYRDRLEFVTTLNHIDTSTEPDPKFFRLPEGFQLVH